VTIVRVGTNKKYSDNWDSIFGKGRSSKKETASKKSNGAAKKTKKAASPKKATGKKGKKK
jgi:hypothetical protein